MLVILFNNGSDLECWWWQRNIYYLDMGLVMHSETKVTTIQYLNWGSKARKLWRWRRCSSSHPVKYGPAGTHWDSLCFLPFYLFILHLFCAYIMSGNSIKVVCRFRPQNALENREGGTPIIDIGSDGTEVALKVSPPIILTLYPQPNVPIE